MSLTITHQIDEDRLGEVAQAVSALRAREPEVTEEAALARIFLAGVAATKSAYGRHPILSPARITASRNRA